MEKVIKKEWCENFIKSIFAKFPEARGIETNFFWKMAEESGLWERDTYGTPMSEALRDLITVETVRDKDDNYQYTIFVLKKEEAMTLSEQTNRYSVKFNVPEYNSTIEFTRTGSPAFRYGNNTCVRILRTYADGTRERNLYDSRYDATVSNFDKWCQDYLDRAFDPQYEPKITKID